MHLDPINAEANNVQLMSIEQINALIASEKQAVDNQIRNRLQSDVALINQLGHYIVNSGGKRLRPVLLLLSAKAFGYQGFHHTKLAAVVEFIHTATLLHDDVVDSSELRRGRETANALWGNEASVLVGDFLYSRAFQMMVEVGSMRVMEVLSEATNVIAEGEVMQLMNCNEPDTTEQNYREVIRCKTAKLFEAASQLGAILCNRSETEIQAMAAYGTHLGTAFQLIDDALDYKASSEEMGKNVGDDLAEGKPTLPLIYAMRKGTDEQCSLIREAIEKGGREHIDAVIQIVQETGAIEETLKAAEQEARLAVHQLDFLPASPYKNALASLAEFSINRNH